MQIERIRLMNFRVFQNLDLEDVPHLGFFIGANGTGKSSFFRVFAFLQDALENNVRTALQREGGFHEVVSRGHENEAIEIEIQFRLNITGTERLVTYLLRIEESKGQPVVKREVLKYKRGRYGQPFHFLDFTEGRGFAVTNEEDFTKEEEELNREKQTLASPNILAIKGIGQFERFKAANAFRDLIENWHISDFHIMAARQRVEAGVAEHLSEAGDNLPLVAQYLYEQYPEIFDQILEKLKSRVPGIANVNAEQTVDGFVVLRFQDGTFDKPFVARSVSDGTIKMFAYLVLLHDPRPHPFLCIEEPENQLYPELLGELVEELREYTARGGQVFVSTHSPDLLDAARIDEILWLEKHQGTAKIYQAFQDEKVSALISAGDLPGDLWRQGLLGQRVGV
mgnify:CR=1 FL=1